MRLPDDGVAFLADLLFVGAHPWLRGGDDAEWGRILQRVDPWQEVGLICRVLIKNKSREVE